MFYTVLNVNSYSIWYQFRNDSKAEHRAQIERTSKLAQRPLVTVSIQITTDAYQTPLKPTFNKSFSRFKQCVGFHWCHHFCLLLLHHQYHHHQYHHHHPSSWNKSEIITEVTKIDNTPITTIDGPSLDICWRFYLWTVMWFTIYQSHKHSLTHQRTW